MLIKNVLTHADDLHDGRPIGPYATAEISAQAFKLPHYQTRIRDGLMVVVSEGKPSGSKNSAKPNAAAAAGTASKDASKETS